MKWDITYRKGNAGEIEAVVEAETQEEAISNFIAGKVESVEVNYWALWPEYVEATSREG